MHSRKSAKSVEEKVSIVTIATARSPLSPHHSPLTSASDVLSIHEDEEALVDLLSADEISLELGLVFLPPEIQHLYQAHQVAQ